MVDGVSSRVLVDDVDGGVAGGVVVITVDDVDGGVAGGVVYGGMAVAVVDGYMTFCTSG